MLVLLAACGGEDSPISGGGGGNGEVGEGDNGGGNGGGGEGNNGGGNGGDNGGGGEDPAPADPEPAPPEEPAPAPSEPAPSPSEPETTSEDGIDAWVWAIIGIAAVLLLLVVFLSGRSSGGTRQQDAGASVPPVTPEYERQQVLVSTLGGWTAKGWLVESQSATSAVVSKGGERRQITIDEHGRAFQYDMPASGAAPPPDSGPANPPQ
jgi:hypothetical protein